MGEERSRMPRPLAVGDVLSAALSGKPAAKRLKEGRIWLVWERVVGDKIAAQAQPVTFRDGILTVAVASAPWMQQLNFLKADICARLNRELGDTLVKDLFLKAGYLPKSVPPPVPTERPVRPLTPDEQRWIAEVAGEIEDSELRECVAGLLARHLTSRDAADDIDRQST